MDLDDLQRSKTLSASSSPCNDDDLDVVDPSAEQIGLGAQDFANLSTLRNARKREYEDEGSNGPPKSARVERVYARWCSIRHDGITEVDESKIKCLLSQDERQDASLMRNLVRGLEFSSLLHPLIFDAAEYDDPEIVRLRSVPYFHELLADATPGGSKYSSLSHKQKLIVSVGVRDLFFAVSNGSASEHERQLLDGILQILDDPVDKVQVDGLTISFHPSATFKLAKYIEGLDDRVGPVQARLFAQMMDMPRLFTVFVDPAELSYHNFENIVPLDAWFESKLDAQRENGLSLSFSDLTQPQANREMFVCKLQGASSAMLKEISSLDLYVPPLNKGIRGGDRFIFHSSLLSKALTEALRSSELLNALGGGQLGPFFEFLNYVFRCNKFSPSDANFESHLDTPYFDKARSHVSKYTLLLYLSPSRNDLVLRVQDVALNEIEEMTCIIFDQKYEHEGRPYLDGDKLFLRTELIFQDKHLQHKDRIAELFSEACYMTSQEKAEPPLYLHKTFRGLSFMTNGYSYWFPRKGNAVDARDCALVAILDYFNCKVNGRPFRSMSSSATVRLLFSNNDDIWDFLSSRSSSSQTLQNFRRLTKGDVESLMPKERDPNKPFIGLLAEWDGDPEDLEDMDFPEDGDGCCPMHSHPMFNPWKNQDVLEVYESCCQYARDKLFGSPVLMLNQEVVINEANIKLIGDKVYFLQETNGVVLPPLNFAACWADEPEPPAFIGLEKEIVAPTLLIPPITLHQLPQGYQLGLDFFRNDWMVQVDDERTIPVPNVAEDLATDEIESAYLSKISEPTKDMKRLFDYFGN
ncbi:hypothetical protein EDB81DRAFT_948974 [Dactylonectria macrodidyma]|uniref:Uncharacterized protein n=1 Tax=Dactylonectria macrodidyma TaxID=307937 RepID=A0A9P9IZH1_9HYPO|nr:hypothetical protein EDB81DRAFT_948974 [Dactylonectria macrodidyma]